MKSAIFSDAFSMRGKRTLWNLGAVLRRHIIAPPPRVSWLTVDRMSRSSVESESVLLAMSYDRVDHYYAI